MMKSLRPLRALLVALAAGLTAHAQPATSVDVTPGTKPPTTKPPGANTAAGGQRQGADRPSDADGQPPAGLSTYSRATLPPPGRPGRLARITDDNRGVRLDTGGMWADLSGRVYNPQMFGARGDVVALGGNYADSGCTVVGRSATLTCTPNVFPPGVAFTSGDVGKKVMVVNAGAGANIHETTIRAVTSPTSVILADAAPVGGIHATAYYGTDDTTALQAALNAADAAGGGKVQVPRGGYFFTTLALRRRVTFEGAGIDNTTLYTNTTGDALTSNWPLNRSTAVNITLQDFTAVALNRASRGAVFEDVGGTYVKIFRVKFGGGRYGVKFDQTELSEIDMSEITAQLPGGAGLWLLNGGENSPGASGTYTNRISVSRTQFNSDPGVTLIADDGGATHTYVENNYNGGTTHIRLAGCAGCSIIGGEFESATGANIVSIHTGFVGGGGKGQNTNLKIDGAFLVNMTYQPAIAFTNGSPVYLTNNFFSTPDNPATTAVEPAVVGLSNIAILSAFGNAQHNTGALFEGVPAFYSLFNAADGGFHKVSGLEAAGLRVGPAAGLPAATGTPYLLAQANPKLFFSDGTGYNLTLSARRRGATSDLFTFRDNGSFAATGSVTGAAIALDADTTWTKGAGPPPPGTCTPPKLGSLYTDKSTGRLFVCEVRSGAAAWAAK